MAVLQRHKSTIYGLNTDLTNLQNQINSEVTTRGDEITRVEGLISDEETARIAADGDLTTLSTTNKTDLVSAINELVVSLGETNTAIDAEIVDRGEEITRVEGLISVEATTRGDEITRVEGLISDEETARGEADTVLDTRITNLEDQLSGSANDLQAELDSTQAGAGLAADGSYVSPFETNYIDATTSLADADVKLDTAIKANENAITTLNADSSTVGSVDYRIAQVIDSAPEALDTLNELAAAIGDDANYSATVVQLITDAKDEIKGSVTEAYDTLAEVETALNTINGDSTVAGSIAKAQADAQDYTDGEISTLSDITSDLQVQIDDEESARISADESLQSELDATQAGAGLAADGSYVAKDDLTNYIVSATSLDNADVLLDAAIKVNEDAIAAVDGKVDQEISDRAEEITRVEDLISDLDEDTYSIAETDAAIANGGAIFTSETLTVSGDSITLSQEPKNGIIFNFATVRHVDANFVSYDIPVTGTGSTFTLAADTSGQFDGKTVIVQYAYTPSV